MYLRQQNPHEEAQHKKSNGSYYSMEEISDTKSVLYWSMCF